MFGDGAKLERREKTQLHSSVQLFPFPYFKKHISIEIYHFPLIFVKPMGKDEVPNSMHF